MKRIVYLTFNDSPGGIYTSQVIDTCSFLQTELKCNVTLVAFISIRHYFTQKKIIASQFPYSIVLPMWPGIQRWRRNRSRLHRLFKRLNTQVVICRGVFAANLAMGAHNVKVCFDGRGAYHAEFDEYDVSSGKISSAEILRLESDAVLKSDFRLSVSNALVHYWKQKFGYSSSDHSVIPCTLSSRHLREVDFSVADSESVTIVFSGGSGKWQSLGAMYDILIPCFERNPKLKLLMLTRDVPQDFKLMQKFPERVKIEWVSEVAVPSRLAECDYGWLYREDTVTNRVASPVKFAEYLSAGLSVIISPALGDFSEFVELHDCGIVCHGVIGSDLQKPETGRKTKNRELALKYFVKKNYRAEYEKIIS